MRHNIYRLLEHFSRRCVLHRDEVKNDLPALRKLVRKGLVQKVIRNGRVFYELTEKALPLLDHFRKMLLERLALRSFLEQRSSAFPLLREDIRYLDEKSPEAEEFLFLGDWQLTRPVVSAQLQLAKLRFYQERVAPRRRRGKAA